jgi:murein DD-endopeptidase MepM/ murein hydrolase activator NlpD
MNYLYPVPATSRVTQTYAEHVERARRNGWCTGPGNCPGGIYYYGGIDWAVPTGTPIEAAQAGVVTEARKDATGYGWHVRIQHADKSLTVYGHGSKLLVSKGETVEAGQVVMLSGNTGNSTGPHLHFELRDPSGRPIDPAPLLVHSLDGEQPEPTPTAPQPEPGELATVLPGWNLRAGPDTSTPDLGTTDAPVAVEVKDRQGDWYRITFDAWVHRDALD